MIPTWFFPAGVSALAACAGIVYLSQRNYRLAIMWFGVSFANAAAAGLK